MTLVSGYVVVMSGGDGVEGDVAGVAVLDADQCEGTVLSDSGRDAQLAILITAAGVDLTLGSEGDTVVPAERHLSDLEGDLDLDEGGLLGSLLVIERELACLVVAIDKDLVSFCREVVGVGVEGGQLVGSQMGLLVGRDESVLSLGILFRLERSPLIHLIMFIHIS